MAPVSRSAAEMNMVSQLPIVVLALAAIFGTQKLSKHSQWTRIGVALVVFLKYAMAERIDLPPPRRERMWIKGCRVVNAWSDHLSKYGLSKADLPLINEAQDIIVDTNGKIAFIGNFTTANSGGQEENATQVEHEGCYVFPGLIDSHVHNAPGSTHLFWLLHLLHGVTTIRELAGPPGFILKQKAKSIASGELAGPRFLYVGQALDGPRPATLGSEPIKTEKQARRAVQTRKEEGAFGIKIFNNMDPACLDAAADEAKAQGIAVVGHCPTARPLSSCRLDDIQHLTGVPAMPSGAWGDDKGAFQSWLSAWQRCDEERLQSVAQDAIRLGQIFTPTLSLYFHALHEAKPAQLRENPLPVQVSSVNGHLDSEGNPDPKLRLDGTLLPPHSSAVHFTRHFLPKYFETVLWSPERLLLPYYRCMCCEVRDGFPAAFPHMLRAVRSLHAHGVIIHAGTDCITPYVAPGRGLYEELMLLVQCGFSYTEALAATTSLPGSCLSALPRFQTTSDVYNGINGVGFIRPGAPADLIVSRVDPTKDLPAALNSIVAVIADGRLVNAHPCSVNAHLCSVPKQAAVPVSSHAAAAAEPPCDIMIGRYYTVEDLKERVRRYQRSNQNSLANFLLPWVARPLRALITMLAG